MEPMGIGGSDADVIPSNVREAVAVGAIVGPNSGQNPGAFTYHFSLALPPGRNGETPDLDLTYSSTNHSDSGFGYGWGISIPYIERYNKAGFASLYSTTTPSTDFYSSMSGELVASTSSQYLARNDDGSDLRYSFSGNAWTVMDKQGNTYFFGSTSTSQQTDPEGSGKVFKWLLQKETDANGNSVTYSYTKDLGQIYPLSVTYTDTATSTGIFAVDFSLQSRATSTATSTSAGFPVLTRYQVNTISVAVNGATTTSYALAYGFGDNGSRTILDTITETGIDSSGSNSLPPTSFSYSTSTISMATSTWSNPVGYFIYGGLDRGVEVADVNGDGLADLAQSYEVKNSSGSVIAAYKNVYMNTGAGWTTATSSYSFPCDFIWAHEFYSPSSPVNAIQDAGGRLVDLNGDGLPDLVCGSASYINDGTDWVANSAWNLATSTTMVDPWGNTVDGGIRFADVNGDGLPDMIQAVQHYDNAAQIDHYIANVYLNNGNGWTHSSAWSIPSGFLFTTDVGEDGLGRIFDVNGDGLADLISAGTVYINNGQGWTEDDAWALPHANQIQALEVADVNGDGLADLWYGYGMLADDTDPDSFTWSNKNVYLNTGNGWEDAASSSRPLANNVGNIDDHGETSPRSANISGEGMSDLLVSSLVGHINYSGIMFATGTLPDLLTHITEPGGKEISVTYKSTSDLYDASSTLANPHLPFYFPVAQQISQYDGIATTTNDSYLYQGGTFYFGSSTDRRFAGFQQIDTTDSVGNVTKSYYNTGNGTDSSIGQYNDDQTLIGTNYRTEIYDSAGNLFKVALTIWYQFTRSLQTFFAPTEVFNFDYDGEGTNKASSKFYYYSTTTDDLTEIADWGSVNASNDGFIGPPYVADPDSTFTYFTYAASSTSNLRLLSEKSVWGVDDNIVTDTQYLYDNLPIGSISKGNLTEQDDLKFNTNVPTIRNTYDSNGMLTQSEDARGNSTTYEYDAYDLYPATSTNELYQSTTYTYDYQNGAPLVVIDPNGSVTQTMYDAFGRAIAILRPDVPDYTTDLATTTVYAYDDSSVPRSVHETDYLDASSIVDKYRYLDGFGRDIEDRAASETSGTFKVSDTLYNGLGLTYSTSLPFFSTGTAYTGTSSPADSRLVTTYAYDPLQRVTKVTNYIGSTTNEYGNWEVTSFDADGSRKDYYKNAYGNLTNVVEYAEPEQPATTTYTYDANGDLVQSNDALGNIRDFTYDHLKNLLSAEDLHVATDTTFGTRYYSYDDVGNLTTATTSMGKAITFTYDALNRILTEDSTDTPYTDITYTYDNSSGGVGRLSTVSTAYHASTYYYDLDGNINFVQDAIPGSASTSMEYWYDRQSNPTYVLYPDGAYFYYGYDAAGNLAYVQDLENGAGAWSVPIGWIYRDPQNRPMQVNFGNNTYLVNHYDDNNLDRLYYTVATDGSTASFEALYGYDPAGNISTRYDFRDSDIEKELNLTYDGLSRLTSASTTDATDGDYLQEFGYDALGNMVSNTGTNYLYQGSAGTNYANPNAPTQVGAATYTYDLDGNLLTDGVHTNTWNYKDQLIQSVATIGSTTATSTYTYDENGNRITQTANGVTTFYPNKYFSSATDGSWTKNVYVGNTLLATIEDTATTSSTRYLYPDFQGSIDAVADDTGSTTELLDYYPYGALRLDESSTSLSVPRKFLGQYYDAPTELSYLNARYYNPAQGQFLSQDPVFLGSPAQQNLTDPQSLNSYSYAEDNPIVKSDPTGNCPLCILGLIGAGAGIGETYIGDVLQNRNDGMSGLRAYVPRSTLAQYGVSATFGAAAAIALPENLFVSAGIAAIGSLSEDMAGNERTDPLKAGVAALVTAGTEGLVKNNLGPSLLEEAIKDGTNEISPSTMTQGIRYAGTQGVFEATGNALAQNAVRNNQQISTFVSQSINSTFNSISTLLNQISQTLSSISSNLMHI
jgi:RHS repeat-associated protein